MALFSKLTTIEEGEEKRFSLLNKESDAFASHVIYYKYLDRRQVRAFKFLKVGL